MDQLIERVLAVGAGFAPEHRAGGDADRLTVAVGLLAVAFHFQLLQIGRQQGQRLAVGQGCRGRRAEEVGIPEGEQGQRQRQVVARPGLDEMLVHGAGAGQQLLELPPADGERQRQSDRRPQREAAADPVPEFEDIGGGNAELSGQFEIGRQGDEMMGDGAFPAGGSEQPGAGGVGVGQRLLGGEGLAGDDEQRRARVEAGEQRGDVGAIDVGYEMHGEIRQLLGAQGFGRHPRPEVGAADADIDDIGDAFAGKTAPVAAVHAFTEILHALEHGANLGRFLLVGAQRHMTDGAMLGVVDRLAGQHFLFPPIEVGGSGEVMQQGQRLDVDALLGEVEQQAVLA